MGQPLFPGLPSMGTIPAVSGHQASQRPSSALTATKRSGQTLTSGQPTKKVRIVASGIEAITAPTDASQPVTVTIARTVVPVPTQSSSSGSLSYVGTGLQPPPSLFQQRPTSTSATRIIGTIHHPVVSQPSSILGQAASAAGIGPSARVGSGASTILGGGFRLPPATEPFSVLPSSLIDQEDDDIQVLTDPPSSQRVYVVVGDDVGKPAPPALVAQIKSEKMEAAEPVRGSSRGATLPPHLRRGGSSRNRETEEGGPDEEEDDNDEEDGKEGEEEPPVTEAQKESQEVPQSRTQPPEVEEEDDESLYDPTGYLKSDIIELRDVAFRGETEEARLIKGHLLRCPKGTEPTIEQINKSALFTLRPPSKEYKDEAQEEDEEIDLREIANIHHLWMPHFQKLGVLANCAPSRWQPLVGWPKLYTPGSLAKHFPAGISAWKTGQDLPSLIVVVPPDSPRLSQDHFLNCLHSVAALRRYSLGTGKDRKQFAFCPYCGVRSENHKSAHSHVRRHLNCEYLCEACCKWHTRSWVQMNKHLDECRSAQATHGAPGQAAVTGSSKKPMKKQPVRRKNTSTSTSGTVTRSSSR